VTKASIKLRKIVTVNKKEDYVNTIIFELYRRLGCQPVTTSIFLNILVTNYTGTLQYNSILCNIIPDIDISVYIFILIPQ